MKKPVIFKRIHYTFLVIILLLFTGKVCYVPHMSKYLSVNDLQHRKYFEVGHKMQFVCPKGYYLKGKEYAICSPDGKWDTPTPICVRKYIAYTMKIFSCTMIVSQLPYTKHRGILGRRTSTSSNLLRLTGTRILHHVPILWACISLIRAICQSYLTMLQV